MLGAPPQGCVAAVGAPRLDHAVVAVHDLGRATDRLGGYGFRFKEGRLHADSLLNRHIKFRDGTSIELMSLAGQPTSDIARGYASRLQGGEQGAFVALTASDPVGLRGVAEQAGLRATVTASSGWVFLTFPGVRDAEAVFFAAGPRPAPDPPALTDHGNAVASLVGAWVEAGPRLARVLAELGAVPCGAVTLPDGRTGDRWVLASGSLVLVAHPDPARPARVIGVELQRTLPLGAPSADTEILPGFWLAWR